MKDENAVGMYNASFNLVYNLRFLISPLMISLFPFMSFSARYDVSKLKRLFKRTGRMLIGFGLVISFICFVLGKYIIILLYGEKYSSAVSGFAALAWAIPFYYANEFYTYLLNSMNYQKNVLIFLGVMTAANILINIFVIPKYSFVGAAYVTVISEMIFFVLCLRKLRKLGFYQ